MNHFSANSFPQDFCQLHCSLSAFSLLGSALCNQLQITDLPSCLSDHSSNFTNNWVLILFPSQVCVSPELSGRFCAALYVVIIELSRIGTVCQNCVTSRIVDYYSLMVGFLEGGKESSVAEVPWGGSVAQGWKCIRTFLPRWQCLCASPAVSSEPFQQWGAGACLLTWENHVGITLREQTENKLLTLEWVWPLGIASPVVPMVFISFPWAQGRGCLSTWCVAIAPSTLAPSGEGTTSLDLSFNNFDVYLVWMKFIHLSEIKYIPPSSPHQRNTAVLVAKCFLTSAKSKPVLWCTGRVMCHKIPTLRDVSWPFYTKLLWYKAVLH